MNKLGPGEVAKAYGNPSMQGGRDSRVRSFMTEPTPSILTIEAETELMGTAAETHSQTLDGERVPIGDLSWVSLTGAC